MDNPSDKHITYFILGMMVIGLVVTCSLLSQVYMAKTLKEEGVCVETVRYQNNYFPCE